MAEFNLTIEGFWRSYLVYVVLFPAYLLIVLTPVRLEAVSVETLVVGKLLSYAARIAISTVLLAALCHLLRVGDRFVALIIASNWGFVLQVALLVPIALLVSRGLVSGKFVNMLQTSTLLAVLFYAWFVTRVALCIGGLAAIGMIVADELSSELVGTLIDRLFGIP